jgi:hypothetical protein
LRGAPSITANQIQSILTSKGSPTANEPGFAQCLYQGGVSSGIDPAYALAFFWAESHFGQAGVAATTLSLGNLRGTGPAGSYEGFRAYNSYCQGAQDWYHLLTTSSYYFKAGRYTLQQIIPIYAPPTDNNNDATYISTVSGLVSSWRSQYGQYNS